MTPKETRTHPAPIQVIGLGLPRTSTTSLRDALNLLGFGPCYHFSEVMGSGGRDCKFWWEVDRGSNPTQTLDTVLANYRATVDFPGAIYPEKMLTAFPNAKFILSVRSPEKWYASIKNTIYRFDKLEYYTSFFSPFFWTIYNWTHGTYMGETGFHKGRFLEDGIKHFEAHNAKVKALIPKEQLLVMEVGKDGWEPLCKFLDVPVPDVPFPHVNDMAEFQARFDKQTRSARMIKLGVTIGFGLLAAVGWNYLRVTL